MKLDKFALFLKFSTFEKKQVDFPNASGLNATIKCMYFLTTGVWNKTYGFYFRIRGNDR